MSFNIKVPFQTIKEFSLTTGLSEFQVKEGIKDGTIPFVFVGKAKLVNVAKLTYQSLSFEDEKKINK